MTSRRKCKRSVSLRSSSFIRLISPFRSKNLTEEERGEKRGEEVTGSVLGTALSDSHLHLSCKSTDSWRVNVDKCDTEKTPVPQNKVRQNVLRGERETDETLGTFAGSVTSQHLNSNTARIPSPVSCHTEDSPQSNGGVKPVRPLPTTATEYNYFFVILHKNK